MTIIKKCIPSLMFATALTLGSVAATQPAHAVAYENYDENNDFNWNEEEWRGYSYDAIDYNNDGFIDQAEWDNFAVTWYAPFNRTNNYRLTYYDTNGDGLLDKSEYAVAYDPNLFYSWDLDDDGYFDQDEYNIASNVYSRFDPLGVFDW